MTGAGLEAVNDASRLFLSDRRSGAVGSVVVPTLDGQRPLLVEVQALTVPRPGGSPRRETRGIDRARLAVLLAVLERRAGLPVAGADVYAVASGGARLGEPGVDLAVALAVASCIVDVAVAPSTVALGEIGLGGGVRPVAAVDRRLDEAARMGFETAVVPPDSPGHPDLETAEVADLKSALAVTGLFSAPVDRRKPAPYDGVGTGAPSPWNAADQALLTDPRAWGDRPHPPRAMGGDE
jgi:DNA repair protein RadA/Sms